VPPYAPLLAHLVGDYVLQSHVMATRKTSSWMWALIHAFFYTLPFLLLTHSPVALLVIGGTHAVIDRLRLAAKWCAWYGVGFPGIWWHALAVYEDHPVFGTRRIAEPPTFKAPPDFLAVWLVILVDNTLHLCINAAALAWG
jgi:hypothetical protein